VSWVVKCVFSEQYDVLKELDFLVNENEDSVGSANSGTAAIIGCFSQ
jgi:hypothetical protein